MRIPKHYRQQLKHIGYRHWVWDRVPDWAFGERYRLRGRIIVYTHAGKILSIRKGGQTIWRL